MGVSIVTDETFFELHLAIFGRQPYNPLWDILTGTGLAYLKTTVAWLFYGHPFSAYS